jgi:hypothetical protein
MTEKLLKVTLNTNDRFSTPVTVLHMGNNFVFFIIGKFMKMSYLMRRGLSSDNDLEVL